MSLTMLQFKEVTKNILDLEEKKKTDAFQL